MVATPLTILITHLQLSIRVSMLEYVRLVTETSSWFPWNGRGQTQRLAEMTERWCSRGDSQGLLRCFNPLILGIPTVSF